MTSNKLVYLFKEGNAQMKELLGGKGANLAEMTRIGLPVPPGFIISTKACNMYYEKGDELLSELRSSVKKALESLEEEMGKKFGDVNNPLLISVRSGAAVSMPGMMDTILNLGLNDETVKGLAEASGDARFAQDCYRRFIQMFGNVVLKVDHLYFEKALENKKDSYGALDDTELTAEALEELVEEFKEIIYNQAERSFPQDPMEQLMESIQAVFDSWNNQRAVVYRKVHKIPDDLGTAINVQTMVFGNLGNDCATGVAFTRDPATGEPKLYGEFLVNAQGEDVVAGIRTPLGIERLKEIMPDIYQEFLDICNKLEEHYKDIQDIEFTIEKGKLYILQTRTGKRTSLASVRSAVDFVKDGIITKNEAILRIEPQYIDRLLHRQIDPQAEIKHIARGLPASPGAASGKVIFNADEAEKLSQQGIKVVLVRPETTPDDIHGIVAAEGILTSRGGMTSHAAVVARGMGKPCVSGCEALSIDLEKEEFQVDGVVYSKGDIITIDGATGRVIVGEVPLIEPELSGQFREILDWCDEVRNLGIRANADNPLDALKAREFGAEGIGLCRTEHMFMAQERLPVVQRMILSENKEEREEHLGQLLPMQQEDFTGIFEAMEGLPVTIRLLDPPLHEFLPHIEELVEELTKLKSTEGDPEKISQVGKLLKKVRSLSEFNPMLGHRGCRLGIVYPEIYEMQVEAIIKAAVELARKGKKVIPEIMIPLVGHAEELRLMRELVEKTAAEVIRKENQDIEYMVGTMIELPRACVVADQIADHADFFSFGTNDLTQTTLGYSRDDAEGKFLPHYLREKVIPDNPFVTLDLEGVGALVKMGVEKGRGKKKDLKMGICGEHGGDPESIIFCHEQGLNYVSCSPYRVPVARLAAAQASLGKKTGGYGD
ncbi:MAG: pyruvate, phosphate dikinase [Candidatus Syntrophonatronum acetioxidans]|uniref:Pyruvate, phosphate dikinase n=1 Tax=Candidatus Syntrophonatronum acetioxidans TaxID=1795816 RepID=A0A424YE19_9FIRM|nr:MAG: pyruvate, phosphate dikinase [Candidatus Syntrophonatronum acetioxidans]